MKCNPKCIYFPQNPNKVISEKIDENKIRNRKVIRLCGYNMEQIKDWYTCHRGEPKYENIILL